MQRLAGVFGETPTLYMSAGETPALRRGIALLPEFKK